MYVCHCMGVTDRTVDAVIAAGASTVDEVTDLCQAGGGCGSCHEVLQALLDAVGVEEPVLAVSAA
jgi:bacterioferritin-associated ferredoxin